jgi:hypothetical protein
LHLAETEGELRRDRNRISRSPQLRPTREEWRTATGCEGQEVRWAVSQSAGREPASQY